jgi:hypothetical protein
MAELTLNTIIKKHLEEGRLEEARAAIRTALQTVAKEHQGQLLTEYTAAYMETMNHINRQYAEVIDKTLKGIKSVDRVEKKLKTTPKKAAPAKISRRK